MPHRRVMLVGHACLDIINTLPAYPSEDADVRAVSNTKLRGGNAANSAAVVASLASFDPGNIFAGCWHR